MVEDILLNSAINLKDSLSKLCNSGIKEYHSFSIDCESLKDYNYEDIRDSPEFRDEFKELEKLEGPVLYWFEITSDVDNNLIREKLKEYKRNKDAKSTPALKKNFDLDSKCLYVGKVKRIVWGRIIQHMDFYKVSQTQGLQLYYWTKGLNLDLKVHFYGFNSNFSDLISIFEIEVARSLHPIIGKH